MSKKKIKAALPDYYTIDETPPSLIGNRCVECGTYYFPKQHFFCRNPGCESDSFTELKLSRTGKIWSFTNACYQPPEPYVSADPFEPYAIAAIELEQEKMIVLGQIVDGVDLNKLKLGQEMELIIDTLYATEEDEYTVWKWRPL